MLRLCLSFALMLTMGQALAQSPVVGEWKRISATIDHQGQKIDMHAALLQQRPCVARIVYRITADGNYRVDTSQSGCDDKYRSIQEKLYGKMRWKVDGQRITLSTLSDFSVGQTYTFSVSGNRMTWTGTEGQGVTVYQRR